MQMKSLLRALDRDPEFARSEYRLRLENGTETTVRDYCVELADVAQKHRKRRHLYWGSIMFARPDTGERGGAWLFTAKGEPNLLVTQELVEHIGDLDELAGALFMVWGWLNVPKNRPDGHPYLIVSDPHRLTISLAD
ncbi:hypothetical protein [Plantibacter sp. RU18]|uniref:hypothetical protein n=1 Tax=Plantibacter sp. RU18 TaxID=3158143 RepID=UPI003D36E658